MENKKIILAAVLLVVIVILAGVFYLIQSGLWPIFQNQDIDRQPRVMFEQVGNLVKNAPGAEEDRWFLLYDLPGQPAVAVRLVLDDSSLCQDISGEVNCSHLADEVIGSRVKVVGDRQGDIVTVVSLVFQLDSQIIGNFNECIGAGYPVMESYPRQCRTPEGQLFIEEIENNPQTDPIQLNNLQSGQTISSPLELTGQALGTWFFEAVMPVRLEDATGQVLIQSYVEATEDWMTENYINFAGSLEFQAPSAGMGSLIFEKANPSGLPEYEGEYIIPVQF